VSFESSRMTEGVRVRAEDARTPSTPARTTPRSESASFPPPPRAAGGPGWGSDELSQTQDSANTTHPASAARPPSSPVQTGEVSVESATLTEGVRERARDPRRPSTPARATPPAEKSAQSTTQPQAHHGRPVDARLPSTPTPAIPAPVPKAASP
jgi:hypothetical protein